MVMNLWKTVVWYYKSQHLYLYPTQIQIYGS